MNNELRKCLLFKNVILVGPKHSGKTSLGKAISEFCRKEFVDIDELMEKQTRKSPRDLYVEGIEIFKNAEVHALKSIIPLSNFVIASGGGIIDNEEAINLLKTEDFRILYIEVSAKTAWDRICNSEKGLPPFLNTQNPEETHRKLHEKRALSYKKISDFTINAEDKSLENIFAEIFL